MKQTCLALAITLLLGLCPIMAAYWTTIGQPASQWIASPEELRAYRAALPERLPDDFLPTHIWKNGTPSPP